MASSLPEILARLESKGLVRFNETSDAVCLTDEGGQVVQEELYGELLQDTLTEVNKVPEKRKKTRRQIERRAPKYGVNIRHNDDGTEGLPRRVRWGRLDRNKEKTK